MKTRACRELYSSLAGDKKKDSTIWKHINDMRKEYRLSEYSFHEDVKMMQRHFKDNIDSFTAQKIASSVWKAYEKLFYGNGKRISYKRYGELHSLEGKSNKTGIRFKDKKLYWNGLCIPVAVKNTPYERECFNNEIAYCRIARKFIRGRYKYYVQIVFKGTPPVKYDKDTGEVRYALGEGDVGLDIGTSTIAISSSTDVKILELAEKVKNIEKQKRILLRRLGRSRRAMNPHNFNEDGTVRKCGSKKMNWIKSNSYIKTAYRLKELQRKQADMRKYEHECLANYILSLGDKIYVEKMNFKGLQKRSSDTEISEKTGKYKRKKRFGKSLANRAPSMLLDILDRKLRYWNRELIKIDTYSARASQFNHLDGTYKKKKLSERWNSFNGIRVQRDMYSAFLIMNIMMI